ncbi:hypothetical protein [Delftia sp. UME58]|uniref:hypothetical protein n=1 Tax=Delftia sp. UME58 TaxID=1862322 RepID=UPI00287B6DDB|nr:hypothetical protein [Delftia sp. UME58]
MRFAWRVSHEPDLDCHVVVLVEGWAVIPGLYTHLAAAAVAAFLAWSYQGARLGAELAEARLETTTQQLATSTAQRAADARVRSAEQTMNTKYQGALMPPVTARRCCAVILTSCVLFLTACASNPQMPPADLPALPPPTSLSTPLPSTPYTTTAAQRMRTWQQKLQGTQLMSKPTGTPGL